MSSVTSVKLEDPVCSFDPETWFDDDPRPAVGFCRSCSLQLRCLLLGVPESSGVWGGTTPVQRVRMRKRAFGGVKSRKLRLRMASIVMSGRGTAELLSRLPAVLQNEPLVRLAAARTRDLEARDYVG